MSATHGKLDLTKLDASALVIRPGDTLVISLHDTISIAQMDDIRAEVEKLPGVKALVIDGASSLAVYRPDET